MELADIRKNGFNNLATGKYRIEAWTLQFLPTATLTDIVDCIGGLEVDDDGGFLFLLAQGKIEDATVDVAVPTDGSAGERLAALRRHGQVQSIVGTSKPGSTYHLLHQKPGALCGLLEQAARGHLPMLVGSETVYGPAGPGLDLDG